VLHLGTAAGRGGRQSRHSGVHSGRARNLGSRHLRGFTGKVTWGDLGTGAQPERWAHPLVSEGKRRRSVQWRRPREGPHPGGGSPKKGGGGAFRLWETSPPARSPGKGGGLWAERGRQKVAVSLGPFSAHKGLSRSGRSTSGKGRRGVRAWLGEDAEGASGSNTLERGTGRAGSKDLASHPGNGRRPWSWAIGERAGKGLLGVWMVRQPGERKVIFPAGHAAEGFLARGVSRTARTGWPRARRGSESQVYWESVPRVSQSGQVFGRKQSQEKVRRFFWSAGDKGGPKPGLGPAWTGQTVLALGGGRPENRKRANPLPPPRAGKGFSPLA